jgi:glycosyltransferase involved in cell wall biosynthesis
MIEVSILIPTLNEEGNVIRVYNLVSEVFKLLNLNYEVIFIDDNSSDKTIEEIELIKNDNVKVINSQERLGLGHALEQGMQISQGKYTMFIDCDCSVRSEDVLNLVNARDLNTLVVGSRYLENSLITGAPKLKVLLSRFLNFIMAKFFDINLHDVSHSFRIFNSFDFNDFKVKTHPGFFWLLTYELKVNNFILTEIPIHFNERTVGITKNITRGMLHSVYVSTLYLFKRKYDD